MGVYYSLAYGVALTDQFGEKLDDIPKRFLDFGREQRKLGDNSRVQGMYTVEEDFLVLGVAVPEGVDDGLTWRDGQDTFGDIHQKYLDSLAQCPEDIQALIKDGGFVPRLCVLAGDF